MKYRNRKTTLLLFMVSFTVITSFVACRDTSDDKRIISSTESEEETETKESTLISTIKNTDREEYIALKNWLERNKPQPETETEQEPKTETETTEPTKETEAKEKKTADVENTSLNIFPEYEEQDEKELKKLLKEIQEICNKTETEQYNALSTPLITDKIIWKTKKNKDIQELVVKEVEKVPRQIMLDFYRKGNQIVLVGTDSHYLGSKNYGKTVILSNGGDENDLKTFIITRADEYCIRESLIHEIGHYVQNNYIEGYAFENYINDVEALVKTKNNTYFRDEKEFFAEMFNELYKDNEITYESEKELETVINSLTDKLDELHTKSH